MYMENTPAKDISRRLFYNFVKDAFSSKELEQARAVVLLGRDKRELPFLDELNIPRHHITCVENDQAIYKDLHLWNMHQEMNEKVEIFFYDLTDYLRFLIEREQNVAIFNLDIIGTLENNILPQFQKIITLGKEQPKTVIGTYLTAARDQKVLLNSFESSVWLMLFDSRFKAVMEKLFLNFYLVGYQKKVAFTHTFRVMQWLYRMLKEIVEASHPRRVKMMSLSKIPKKIWEEVLTNENSLTWGALTTAISKHQMSQKIKELSFTCAPTELRFVAYRSKKNTQLCHFMKMEKVPSKKSDYSLDSIIEVMLKGLERFYFAGNKETPLIVITKSKQSPSFDAEQILSKDLTEKFKDKVLAAPVLETPKPKASKPKKLPQKDVLWSETDKFSEEGRLLVKKLAGEGKKPVEIAKYFPETTPFRSIAAMVAISNRKPKAPKEIATTA